MQKFIDEFSFVTGCAEQLKKHLEKRDEAYGATVLKSLYHRLVREQIS